MQNIFFNYSFNYSFSHMNSNPKINHFLVCLLLILTAIIKKNKLPSAYWMQWQVCSCPLFHLTRKLKDPWKCWLTYLLCYLPNHLPTNKQSLKKCTGNTNMDVLLCLFSFTKHIKILTKKNHMNQQSKLPSPSQQHGYLFLYKIQI